MKKLHITIIVDISSSMHGKHEEASEGVQKIALDNPDAKFTLIEFGSKAEVVFKAKKAKKLLNYKMDPDGMTAMWDGIGAGLSLLNHDNSNLVVVVTDGQENASNKWTQTHVKPLLKAATAAQVEFLFLGADPNAIELAKASGIKHSRVHAFRNTKEGTDAAFSIANDTSMMMMNQDITSEDLDKAIADKVKLDKNLATTY